MTDLLGSDAWPTTNYKIVLPAGEPWNVLTADEREFLEVYIQIPLHLRAEAKVWLQRLAQAAIEED